MNTQKQVLIMSVLLLMSLIVVAIYAAWYPSRADDAEAHFEEARAERGAILFARNCRLCHGDLGEGGALGGKLAAAPALNRPDLQGFEMTEATLTTEINPTAELIEVSEGDLFSAGDVILIDEERMQVTGADGNSLSVQRGHQHSEPAGHFPNAPIWAFDDAVLAEHVELLTNTIACGRVGTAMPPWAQEHGGPLSDEQIDQLIVLITTASWDLVQHEIDIEDVIDSELAAPVGQDDTEIQVTDITRFVEGEALRLGGERIRVVEVPDFDPRATNVPGTLVVERGVLNTFAMQHGQDVEVFRFGEPAEPAITEMSCGQRAAAPQETGPCEEEDGVVQIAADDLQFSCSEIQAEANEEVTVAFENQEAAAHNIAFYESEDDLTPVAEGAVGPVFSGPNVTEEMTFTAPDAGEYFFRCDVHPVQMTGAFIVE